MARRRRSGTRNGRKQDLAPKLIGVGLLLVIVPFFLRTSPLGTALGALAPFGLLSLIVGCAMLWWKIRERARSDDSLAVGEASPTPFRRSSRAPSPVDRTPTELDRLTEARSPSSSRVTPTSWSPAVFDVIEWRRFEALVEALFAQAGFETKSQSHGADEGIDIWLYSRNNPGAPVSVVQCKHWQGKRVGVDKVRELRGVMAAKNVTRGQFATTSTFTDDAVAFAKANGINLLDVQGLLGLIAKRTEEQQQALLAVALEGEHWRPTCVNCGTKMVERSPRKGGTAFWGCEGYPKCKTTMPMRTAASAV